MLSKKYYLEQIKQFIKNYFPNPCGVMITGSFVTKYFNETSDLDVIVLSNLYRNLFIESYLFHGIKIQVIVMPVFDLDSLLLKDLQSGGIYIGQLNKGIILKDTNEILHKLQIKARTLYYHGPMLISRFQFNQLRARITTRLEDIKGNDNYEENLFTVIDLYPRIIDLYFKMNNYWSYTSKYACRELFQTNQDLLNDLVLSINNFICNKDKKAIITFTSNFLEKTGGELHFSSTREYSENKLTDKLIIFISDIAPENHLKELNLLSTKLEKFLLMHCPKLQVCSYYYPSKRIYRSGLYILCYAEGRYLNESVIPLIEMFHFGLYQSSFDRFASSFFYPYEINPFDVFGNTVIQKNIAFLLSYLKEHKCNDLISYSIFVLGEFCSMKVFENPCRWHEFWTFCYDIFDKSGNVEYLPQNIVRYFSKNKKEINEQRYAAFNYTATNIQNKEIGEELKSRLLQLETDFDKFGGTASFLDILGSTLATDKLLKDKGTFYFLLLKLTETIMNCLGLNFSDQLFVVYFLSRQ